MSTVKHHLDELIEVLKVNDREEIYALEEERGRQWKPEEPREAMDALIRIGAPAVEPLLKLLKDTTTWSIIYAIQILGKIGDSRAVEPLIKLLESEDVEYLGEEPIYALQRIGLPALQPVLDYLEKDTLDMIDALAVLKGIKDEKAFKALVDALSHPHREVQDLAVAYLGDYGDKRAVKHLVKLLDNPDIDTYEVKGSLRQLVDRQEYRSTLAAHNLVGKEQVTSLKERVYQLMYRMKHAYEFEEKFEGDDAKLLNDIAREYEMSVSIEKILEEVVELAVDEALISNEAYKEITLILFEELLEPRFDFEREHEEELNIINRKVPNPVKEEKRSYKGLTRTGWGPHPKLDELCNRIWEWLKRQQFLVTKRNRTLLGRKGKKDSRKGCYIRVEKDKEKPRTWGLVGLIVWGNAWTGKEAETFTESFWEFVETSGLVKIKLRLKDLHTIKDAIIYMKVRGLRPCYNKSGVYFRPHIGKKKRKLLADLLKVDSKEAVKKLRDKYEL